jgi:hypothetical protein
MSAEEFSNTTAAVPEVGDKRKAEDAVEVVDKK